MLSWIEIGFYLTFSAVVGSGGGHISLSSLFSFLPLSEGFLKLLRHCVLQLFFALIHCYYTEVLPDGVVN